MHVGKRCDKRDAGVNFKDKEEGVESGKWTEKKRGIGEKGGLELL